MARRTCRSAFARLTIVRSTVIGEVATHAIALAENTIFLSHIVVGRRQQGCVRFCYVMPGSRTPRRYHCQPDLVIAALRRDPAGADRRRQGDHANAETQRVRPRFNSRRYGIPTTASLPMTARTKSRAAPMTNLRWAFSTTCSSRNVTANLRTRLDEYTPAGMEAGIVFAS